MRRCAGARPAAAALWGSECFRARARTARLRSAACPARLFCEAAAGLGRRCAQLPHLAAGELPRGARLLAAARPPSRASELEPEDDREPTQEEARRAHPQPRRLAAGPARSCTSQ